MPVSNSSMSTRQTGFHRKPNGIIKPASTDEFDKLLSMNVPHIHEGIFFSLDYESFVACRKVSRKWSELLSTEPFQRRETELKRAWTDESRLRRCSRDGDVERVRELLAAGIFIYMMFTSTK